MSWCRFGTDSSVPLGVQDFSERPKSPTRTEQIQIARDLGTGQPRVVAETFQHHMVDAVVVEAASPAHDLCLIPEAGEVAQIEDFPNGCKGGGFGNDSGAHWWWFPLREMVPRAYPALVMPSPSAIIPARAAPARRGR